MSLTRTQVSQLYVILLGRASEGDGNTYWMTGQLDMTATANIMLETAEVKTYFGSTLTNNQAFIQHIYLNSFGKTYSQDKTGVDYWVAALNAGMSRGEIVNTIIVAVQEPSNAGAMQDQFNNRVEVSDYTASKIAKVADLATFKGFIDSVTNDDKTVTAAKTAVDEESITLDGVVSDGYIKGATIFADANGDGVWNPGEAKTTTDHLGNFTLKNAEGPLVATGGTDISTGIAYEGTFCAPEGSTVITPITTLIDQVMQSATNSETGEPLTADEAMALIADALGLSSDIDFLAFDPMATVTDATSTAEEQADAVDVQAVSVQIANMIGQAAAMLDGAGITTEESGAVPAAAALANIILEASGAIDLTSTATVETFLENSATQADATAAQIATVEAVAADIATATANVNGAMADAAASMEDGTSAEDIFTKLAQTQVAAEDIEDLVESGAETGDAGAAEIGRASCRERVSSPV